MSIHHINAIEDAKKLLVAAYARTTHKRYYQHYICHQLEKLPYTAAVRTIKRRISDDLNAGAI